jgi:acyl-CoA synthetase (NDP forming)
MDHFDLCGQVYGVGQARGAVRRNTVLASVSDLSGGIDVAVIITPAASVPRIIDQCGKRSIRWIVETADFAECSKAGKRLGHLVLEMALPTDTILRLSQLLAHYPEIKGVEVNPFFVFRHGSGGVAVDARIVLNS